MAGDASETTLTAEQRQIMPSIQAQKKRLAEEGGEGGEEELQHHRGSQRRSRPSPFYCVQKISGSLS